MLERITLPTPSWFNTLCPWTYKIICLLLQLLCICKVWYSVYLSLFCNPYITIHHHLSCSLFTSKYLFIVEKVWIWDSLISRENHLHQDYAVGNDSDKYFRAVFINNCCLVVSILYERQTDHHFATRRNIIDGHWFVNSFNVYLTKLLKKSMFCRKWHLTSRETLANREGNL